jgi:hypothetical protein
MKQQHEYSSHCCAALPMHSRVSASRCTTCTFLCRECSQLIIPRSASLLSDSGSLMRWRDAKSKSTLWHRQRKIKEWKKVKRCIEKKCVREVPEERAMKELLLLLVQLFCLAAGGALLVALPAIGETRGTMSVNELCRILKLCPSFRARARHCKCER